MIEYWMGAKWGFYKFPLSPDYAFPDYPGELLWREQDPKPEILAPDQPVSDAPHHAALQFDLRLPLDEQWEEANIQLAALRRLRQKNKLLRPRIRDNIPLWQCCLIYLDADDSDANIVKEACL